MQPYMVQKITDAAGRPVQEFSPTVRRRVISEQTSATMRELMEYTVTDGNGKNAAVKGYRVGGKSGTSQKLDSADEKARIAKAAREHISPGEKIILDSGTTVLELAKLVNDIPDLTVVTNDLHIASEVSIFPNATLLMVGGVVRKGFNSTYGYFAEKMLGSISVNKTFLSIDAVDMEQGLLSYITDDTNIKKQYIKSGKEVILLCDHTKFQASAFINISQLDCIHRIIVGKELDGEYVERLESMGIDVELV